MATIYGYLGIAFSFWALLRGTRVHILHLRKSKLWKFSLWILGQQCHERKGSFTNCRHQTVLLSQSFSGLDWDGYVCVFQPAALRSPARLRDYIPQNHQNLLGSDQVGGCVGGSFFVSRLLNDKLVKRGSNSDDLSNGGSQTRKGDAIRGCVFFDGQNLEESDPQALEAGDLGAVSYDHRLPGLLLALSVTFV